MSSLISGAIGGYYAAREQLKKNKSPISSSVWPLTDESLTERLVNLGYLIESERITTDLDSSMNQIALSGAVITRLGRNVAAILLELKSLAYTGYLNLIDFEEDVNYDFYLPPGGEIFSEAFSNIIVSHNASKNIIVRVGPHPDAEQNYGLLLRNSTLSFSNLELHVVGAEGSNGNIELINSHLSLDSCLVSAQSIIVARNSVLSAEGADITLTVGIYVSDRSYAHMPSVKVTKSDSLYNEYECTILVESNSHLFAVQSEFYHDFSGAGPTSQTAACIRVAGHSFAELAGSRYFAAPEQTLANAVFIIEGSAVSYPRRHDSMVRITRISNLILHDTNYKQAGTLYDSEEIS